MSELTIILDFVIIFLLITAITYGFFLNRRIKLIHESGREISNLFRSFDETILRAEVGIDDLKKVSGQVSEGLQKKIDKAALLIDDLEFLEEKTNKAADRVNAVLINFKKIEGSLPPQRTSTANQPQTAKPVKSVIPEKPSLKSRKLVDLLEEVSGQQGAPKKPVSNNNKVVAQPLNIQENTKESNIDKKQFSIASALKALGYGD